MTVHTRACVRVRDGERLPPSPRCFPSLSLSLSLSVSVSVSAEIPIGARESIKRKHSYGSLYVLCTYSFLFPPSSPSPSPLASRCFPSTPSFPFQTARWHPRPSSRKNTRARNGRAATTDVNSYVPRRRRAEDKTRGMRPYSQFILHKVTCARAKGRATRAGREKGSERPP